jgi:hypothetical protein
LQFAQLQPRFGNPRVVGACEELFEFLLSRNKHRVAIFAAPRRDRRIDIGMGALQRQCVDEVLRHTRILLDPVEVGDRGVEVPSRAQLIDELSCRFCGSGAVAQEQRKGKAT